MFKVNPYAVTVNAREIKAKWEAASQLQAFLLELGVVGETCNFQYTLGSRHFD